MLIEFLKDRGVGRYRWFLEDEVFFFNISMKYLKYESGVLCGNNDN